MAANLKSAPINEEKLQAFLGKVVSDFGTALSAPLSYIGQRLGLYKAMAGAGWLTPAELAERTGARIYMGAASGAMGGGSCIAGSSWITHRGPSLSGIGSTPSWSAPGGCSSWFQQPVSTCWEGGGLCFGAFALA